MSWQGFLFVHVSLVHSFVRRSHEARSHEGAARGFEKRITQLYGSRRWGDERGSKQSCTSTLCKCGGVYIRSVRRFGGVPVHYVNVVVYIYGQTSDYSG